jgi:predicted metalloprotease with PDZ domain
MQPDALVSQAVDWNAMGTSQSPLAATTTARVQFDYHVAMPQPAAHLFEVTLTIADWQQSALDLQMPVWTPGSYLVREYARHLQDFRAEDANGQPIPWHKVSKQHWRLHPVSGSTVTIRYRIFANELTVRTNHLDSSHAYFNGAALFFWIPGYEQQPMTVRIALPDPEWRIATALPPVAGQPHCFWAQDFDTLVDSPFEIGLHRRYNFEVLGKPHAYVIWGEHDNLKPDDLIRDTQAIITTEAELFGGLPYDRYLFIVHLSAKSYGGLEHKDCCSLLYDRRGFRQRDQYERFLQLVAHEFFHLWNVKRIRPKELEVFDYRQETYTPSLWFCEGVTSYYDLLIPLRAGLYDAKTYLKHLSEEISRYLTTPGRRVQPLSESSFDAWIKLYRPDANSANSRISYYLKGAMVTLVLDLAMRRQHQNQRSFDDVMRQMWQQFGQAEIGFTVQQLQQVIASVAGFEIADFWARYVDGLEELPLPETLADFGLELTSNQADQDLPPFIGLSLQSDQGRALVKGVVADSPAHRAGVDVGDELLAIDGLRVTADSWQERLQDYSPETTVTLSLFHRDGLHHYPVTLAAAQPTKFTLKPTEHPSPAQQQNFQGWLGVEIETLR